MRKLAVISTALLSACAALVSCQQEIQPVEEPTSTHTISFTASRADTKTTMTIEGKTAYFSWDDDDVNCVFIYENDNEGTINGELNKATGTITLLATFKGNEAPADATYHVNVNEQNITQNPTAECYDRNADILAANEIISAERSDQSRFDIDLVFERIVTINKMTVKGLEANATVSSVVIHSDKDIAGEYENGAWKTTSKTITLTPSGVTADAAGNAVIYFSCFPVADAQLTVDVTTGSDATKKVYTKEFAKAISFDNSQVKTFGVMVEEAMEKEIHHTIQWTSQSDWTGIESDHITLSNPGGNYSVEADKRNGGTKPTVNSAAKDCRVYANGIITISNINPMTEIVFNISAAGLKRLAPITASAGTIAAQTKGDNTVVGLRQHQTK